MYVYIHIYRYIYIYKMNSYLYIYIYMYIYIYICILRQERAARTPRTSDDLPASPQSEHERAPFKAMPRSPCLGIDWTATVPTRVDRTTNTLFDHSTYGSTE